MEEPFAFAAGVNVNLPAVISVAETLAQVLWLIGGLGLVMLARVLLGGTHGH